VTVAPALQAWSELQLAELEFWKHAWPHRDLAPAALQTVRFADATWLLSALGFEPIEGRRFAGFAGRVLEVGCGPIGFFEQVDDIACDAIDTLMVAYAWEVPYARLGQQGATHYLDRPLEACRPDYDFVVCSNVLDRVADWRSFVPLLTRPLRPGGTLLLYTWCRGFTPGLVLDAVRDAGCGAVERTAVRDGGGLFLRASRAA